MIVKRSVLVNNAGIGLVNALEGVSMDTVREVFATNALGTIAMMRAVLDAAVAPIEPEVVHNPKRPA
jgi:NAD(P)-dependent dehydrogenase (short-subunit alcohol dehydrogenase family)